MSRITRTPRLIAAVATVAVAGLALATVPAQATLRNEVGVTSTSITFGITVPMSGIAAPGYNKVAPAAQGYLDYVNDNGGVNGRKIYLNVEDDRYAPATAVSKTNKLVLQDKVFGIAGALGTANHLAVLKSINPGKRGVPDLFVNTGFSGFDDAKKYPTTFMILPSYVMEAKIMGKYLSAKFPDKKIGLIYQDDDFGRNAKTGFATAGTKFDVSKGYASGSQSAATFAGSQVKAMQDAKVDVVVMFGVTTATAAALGAARALGYSAQWILGSVGGDATTLKALGVTPALLTGSIGASFMPSTADDKDPYVAKFKEINDKYNKGKDKTFDNNVFTGMNLGYMLVAALRAAGPTPTRAGVVKALESKGASIAAPGLVPLGYSATSHAGYTGYWFGKYDSTGALIPDDGPGKYAVWVTDSGAGAVTASSFVRPAMPANAIPNN